MKTFKTLASQWKGGIKFAAYHLDLKKGADHQSQIRMKYKLSEKAKLPTLKYYPNRKTNNDKMQKSFEIYIKKHTSVDEIKEEINDSFDHDVREISEKLLQTLMAQHVMEEEKTVAIYFY